jgi:hypothetical protein
VDQTEFTQAHRKDTEHEYFREGAWTYLAAWDVHRAKLFGRCEKKSGAQAQFGKKYWDEPTRQQRQCDVRFSRLHRDFFIGTNPG